jgi:Chaperone of endosialidase
MHTFLPDRVAYGGFENSMLRLLALLAGLTLLVHITQSWGGPTNPTMSDTNGNTAGGSLALQNVVQTPTGGSNNTAFGLDALARYKRDIAPMEHRSDKVLALQPVTFAYRGDTQGVMHYGLIAEEVAAVFPELVTRTASGEAQTVKYHELIPILLNELQRQRSDLARLEALVEQRRGAEASTCTAAERAALAR